MVALLVHSSPLNSSRSTLPSSEHRVIYCCGQSQVQALMCDVFSYFLTVAFLIGTNGEGSRLQRQGIDCPWSRVELNTGCLLTSGLTVNCYEVGYK